MQILLLKVFCWKRIETNLDTNEWIFSVNEQQKVYCSSFSQTFYNLLFSYFTITDVTSYVHHKFPVSFLLYIATKKTQTLVKLTKSLV